MPRVPVHLLVPNDRRRVLGDDVAGTRRLPRLEVEAAEDQPLAAALATHVRDAWSLEPTILETHVQPVADDAYEALAVLEPPATGWEPAHGLSWGEPPARLPEAVAGRAHRWFAELFDGQAPPAGRSAWSRPGWHARMAEWVRTTLEAAGRPAAGQPELRRSWALSYLARIPLADGGAAWFKAVFPRFHHEVAATALLHELRPDRVPRPLGMNVDEGWLLLDDVGGEPLGPRPDQAPLLRSFAGMVDVIRAAAPHRQRLVELGCPRRPLAELAAGLRAGIARSPELGGPAVDPERVERVTTWVDGTAGWLSGIGIPEGLVHGDFNVSNVIDRGHGPVIIDWSDAAISHPLVDVAPWLGHPRAPGDLERQWQAWLDALAELGPVEALRGERQRVLALSAAYHFVTYVDVVAAIEPERRYQLSDGLGWWWSMLEEHVDRTVG